MVGPAPSLGAVPRPALPRLVTLFATAALALAAAGCGASSSTSGQSTATTAPVSAAGLTSVPARPSSGCHRRHPTETSGAHELVVGTETRTYQLAPPAVAGDKGGRPAPLLVLFHGYGGSGAGIGQYTDLPAQAAADGYLVASPDGTARTWQVDAHGTDAAFVTALMAHLEATGCVDEHRVYLAGFSAGAAFTLIYSCQHQDQVAAMATVAVEFQLGCTRPIPLIAFHGTADPSVPFTNGAKGLSLPDVAVRGTELNMGDWARLDHCSATPTETVIGSQVTRQVWPACTGGTAVVLYRVEGGGHTWPGATTDDGGGLTTRQVHADQLILAFFAQHPT
jgi:polyhydroxybutyrate depolymerase